MITLTSVSKQYPGKKAVSDLDLHVKLGEVVGFLGVNGAGKTTTMKMITGVIKPSTGTVSIDGLDPIKGHLQVSRKIGYLPENNPLYPDMRVCEYLDFIAQVKGSALQDDVFARVGLTDVIGRKIETLSRGYKQRVGLAAALLGDPHILVLDEPTSGLDPIEQDKIRALIGDLAKSKIIIFSTHILSEVEDVANRIVIIDGGKKIYDGSKPHGKGAVESLFKQKVRENTKDARLDQKV
jgi:ABC-2 type transport system ATP-binding protein